MTQGDLAGGGLTPPQKVNSKWLTLLAACGGLMMLYIDLFIVNVALPTIGRDLAAPLSSVSWTISGYVLMLGVFPMGMGRLGDLWGHRKLYLMGLGVFILASLACGLATKIELLIIFRLFQGFGAAIMTPATLTLVIRAFPAEQRGLAIGLHGGVSGLGLVLGPLLGGLLVQLESWRLVFFVNIPVGLVALVLTLLFVSESRDETGNNSIDWAGLLFLSLGLLGLMLAFTLAELESWFSVGVLGSFLLSLVSFFIFVKIEQRVKAPLIELNLFGNRVFVLACLGFFFFSAALFGSQPYWSLFMQNYWGFSPLEGGLAYLPATGLIAILTPFSGVLAQRAGAKVRFVALFGIGAMGLSFLYVVVRLGPGSSYLDGFLPAFIIRGLGIPIFSACTSVMVVNSLPLSKAGLASGTLGMVRNVGTALGVAVLGAGYLQHVTSTLPSRLSDLKLVEQQQLTNRASQFTTVKAVVPVEIQRLINEVIVQGFLQLCLVSALFCGAALLTVLAMTRKSFKSAPDSALKASTLSELEESVLTIKEAELSN
jgi:EmrB/QacA subfamily drug resistance transporter